MKDRTSTDQQLIRRDGEEIAISSTIASLVGNATNSTLASASGNNSPNQIGEFIVYHDELTALERQRIESYMAAKYGIHLDQTNGGV